jgi:ABC-type branched-subunit amino acid transport system substrate-binding protein
MRLGLTRSKITLFGTGIIVFGACLWGAVAWLTGLDSLHIAFPVPQSGPLAYIGNESLSAAQLYLDDVNEAGGIDGHRVVLDVIDDKGDPAVARSGVAGIAGSKALLVLGHYLSVASAGAGPLYRDAHIPAVTPFSYADAVTLDNPYYFRVQVTNSFQGRWMMEYLRNVFEPSDPQMLKAPTIQLVYSDDVFGRTFLAGAEQAEGGGPEISFPFDAGKNLTESARIVADRVAQELDPRIIVIGAAPEGVDAMLKALRRRGVRSMIFAAGGSASEGFARGLLAQPEERETPGFFTDNFFVAASVIFDSAGSNAQDFALRYLRATGIPASYVGAQATDGLRVAVEALRRARPRGTEASRAADREAVRDALAGMNSPERGVSGPDERLFFDSGHNMALPMRIGFFRSGRLLSSPLQLVAVDHPELVGLSHALARHDIVQVANKYYWLQRLVYTGVDINRVSRVDVREGRFNVDFYLWMRCLGDADAATAIEFPDAVSPGLFNQAKPIETGTQDNLTYRLYRVSGDFRADFDLHDYPFDRQTLLLRLVNAKVPRQQVAYVTDVFGLRLDHAGETADDVSAFRDLQLWQVLGVTRFVGYFAYRSTLGKAIFFDSETRTEYAEFDTAVQLRRNVLVFMGKTLMPLFLLVAVVFATLFFPHSLSKERTTIPVTGILTSAVLMIAINSQLPPIGYTVSIEYVFYVFFGLCLMAMTGGFVQERLRLNGMPLAATVTDVTVRVLYVLVVLVTVGEFLWHYTVL